MLPLKTRNNRGETGSVSTRPSKTSEERKVRPAHNASEGHALHGPKKHTQEVSPQLRTDLLNQYTMHALHAPRSTRKKSLHNRGEDRFGQCTMHLKGTHYPPQEAHARGLSTTDERTSSVSARCI